LVHLHLMLLPNLVLRGLLRLSLLLRLAEHLAVIVVVIPVEILCKKNIVMR